MSADPLSLQYTLQAWSWPASPDELAQRLRLLVEEALADLPMPGGGDTLGRWRSLATLAGYDLSLLKLFEAHTDAQAITQELTGEPLGPGCWGVWAAEPPQARLELRRDGSGWRLFGRKAWCSGAALLDGALVSGWDAQGGARMVAVHLDQPGVEITGQGWCAVGMAASASVEVLFDGARARSVGEAGAYLERPGFWQGAIGIAAAWYGAAVALAEALRAHCHSRSEPHALAHLGSVDAALAAAAAPLREAAVWIDAHPQSDARLLALRSRALVESSVDTVQRHVGRALGAAPFCRDPRFARLAADLPVFLRQSHAERDLAHLGETLLAEDAAWHL